MKRHSHSFRFLSKALDRLEASDTRLKRKNALTAFSRAMKGLQAQVARQYPKLRKDGSEIVARKPRGAWCPHCKRPMKNFRQLARHLVEILNPPNRRIPECWCKGHFRNMKHLTQHLAGVRDLQQHYIPYAMKEFAKEFS